MLALLGGLLLSATSFAGEGRALFTYREPALLGAFADTTAARSLFHALTRDGAEPGTSTMQLTDIQQRSTLVPGNQPVAFEVPGFEISGPAAVMAPLATGKRAIVYFTMIDAAVARECRKETAELADCPAYQAKRAIGYAVQAKDLSWVVKGPLLEAKDVPGQASPEVSSAFLKGSQVWLYFTSSAGIFRQRLVDGEKPLGPADRLTFDGAPDAATFDRVNVVHLRCDSKQAPFIATMVASLRGRNALPFLTSTDGVTFRQEADTLVKFTGTPLAAPVQLPVTATEPDCRSYFTRHDTNRALVYSERKLPGAWEVKEAAVTIPVNGIAPSTDESEAAPAASPTKRCTNAEYLAARPDAARNPTYANNPMLHYLVFGKDEGACEPAQ